MARKKLREKLKKFLSGENFIVKSLFAVFALLLTAAGTVYSVKTSDWGYGYGYSAYGYRYIFADNVPAAISSLSASSAGTSQINLSWSMVSKTASGTNLDNFSAYKIYSASSSALANKTNGDLRATITNSGAQSYSVTGLNAGATYYFAIYSVDDIDNWSPISNIASAETSVASTTSGAAGGSFASVVQTTPSVEQTEESFATEKTAEKTTSAEAASEKIKAAKKQKDGALIRWQGDYRIYVLENGKKRHIPSQKAFEEAGYDWNSINVVSDSNFGSYETASLIRAFGDYKVYVLNDNGWRRHIQSAEIFNLYGHLGWDKISEVSSSVLKSYPETSLIRAEGDFKVYELKGLKKIWLNITASQFVKSGRKWEAIHIINKAERDFYK